MKSIQAKSCPSELCLFQFWNTYIFKLNSYRIHVQHLPCLTLSLWASKVGSFKQNSHTSALWSSVVDSGLVWALPNPRSEPGISYFLDEAENNSRVLWIGNLKFHNWLSQLAKGFCPNLWESMHAEITWNCSGELWLLCKLLFTAVLFSLLEALRYSNEQVAMCFEWSCTNFFTDCRRTAFQDSHVYWTSSSMNA